MLNAKSPGSKITRHKPLCSQKFNFKRNPSAFGSDCNEYVTLVTNSALADRLCAVLIRKQQQVVACFGHYPRQFVLDKRPEERMNRYSRKASTAPLC